MISDLLRKYGSDKCTEHSYASVYNLIFSRFDRQAPIDILEIGTEYGYSLQAWREYFPNARITAIDIKDQRKVIDPSIEFIEKDVKEWIPQRGYDIIIDDGSHLAPEVVYVAQNFSKFLKPGGYFVIEDVQNPEAVYNLLQEVSPKEAIVFSFDMRGVAKRYDDLIMGCHRVLPSEAGKP